MIYSDINNDIKTRLVEDIDSIYQSIDSILGTRKTERFFNPEFGSELENIIFEPMDDATAFQILTYISDAIERWEPRVKVLFSQSEVEPDYDKQQYKVRLIFQIPDFGNNQTFEYNALIKG